MVVKNLEEAVAGGLAAICAAPATLEVAKCLQAFVWLFISHEDANSRCAAAEAGGDRLAILGFQVYGGQIDAAIIEAAGGAAEGLLAGKAAVRPECSPAGRVERQGRIVTGGRCKAARKKGA